MSVKVSHPFFWCDAGLSLITVNTEFNNNTPCCAHGTKELLSDIVIDKSLSNSLNIFWRDGGLLIELFTEKDNPCASCSPWYGSCPNIKTFKSYYFV